MEISSNSHIYRYENRKITSPEKISHKSDNHEKGNFHSNKEDVENFEDEESVEDNDEESVGKNLNIKL